MIYLICIPMIPAIFLLVASWSQPEWIIRVLFTAMAAVPISLFLGELRFALPIRWRLRWPEWDAFLCRIGSHRCVPICGSRCCWECIRCEKDSPSVKAYFERLERLGVKVNG